MTMAKPSERDFENVYSFMQTCERILNAEVPDKVSAFNRLSIAWDKANLSWERLLWAGKTAIDNACEPNATSLEYKPLLAAAPELLRALKLCVEWMPGATVRSWPPGFRLRDEALGAARAAIEIAEAK